MCALRFELLGPVSALADGQEINLGPPQRRAVLSLLLLGEGQAVSVEKIIEGLWDNSPPITSISIIQVHVHHLRRIFKDNLGEDSGIQLITYPASVRKSVTYRILLPQAGLDISDVNVLVMDGNRYFDRGNWREAVDVYGAALGVWRGPVLSNVPDTKYFVNARRKLEELRFVVEKQRVESMLKLGAFDQAIAELYDLMDKRPMDESVVVSLSSALHQNGMLGESLEVLEGAMQKFEDKLGLPNSKLMQLRNSILAGVEKVANLDFLKVRKDQ